MVKKYKYPLSLLVLGILIIPLIATQFVYVDSNNIVQEPGMNLMPLVPLSILISLLWGVRIKKKES
ncbi:DUF3955 domain-containing protein [Vagococcus carniphilus]|uniref:DUF3955 domain-containing protein n=1 Tax=Vagococcus carniphilus TaxID=218144 RepID=UPI00288F181A|nr:DUF3955 domain-containing protein [Vagococcus carniphilus]MDT2813336.1 DUF3955 domain-containing protein [Vagococcus carniphilus]MDT2865245.1 DUF3955 domain-containing protein [Vagococcus carniphilus]